MKNYIILMALMFSSVKQASSQPCNGYPTKEQLLTSLSNRLSPYYDIKRYNPDCNIDDTIKKKIVKLLDNEWDSSLLASIIKNYVRESFDYAYFGKIISKTNEETDKKFRENENYILIHDKIRGGDTSVTYFGEYCKIRDSIYKKIRLEYQSYFEKKYIEELKNSRMNDDIPLLCGYLYINESKEKLLMALENKRVYNSEAVELSLARLGSKEFQKKIFSQHTKLIDSLHKQKYHMYNGAILPMMQDIFKLTFIGTQESLFLVSDWLDTIFQANYYSEGPSSYLGIRPFPDLINIITNEVFVNMIRDKNTGYTLSEMNITADKLVQLKEWMIDNKGKYKINTRNYWGGL